MVTCSICFWSGLEFKTYGIPTKRGRCPNCGSKPRHRSIAYFLKCNWKLNQKKGLRILEVGPSKVSISGILTNGFFGEDNIYHAIDIRTGLSYLEKIKPPHQFLPMDVTQLNFEDQSFDYILCNQVLSFVPNYSLALQELRRVLKPQGQLMISLATWQKETISRKEFARMNKHHNLNEDFFVENGSQWFFGDDLIKILEQHNLDAKTWDLNVEMSKTEKSRFGLKENEFTTLSCPL